MTSAVQKKICRFRIKKIFPKVRGDPEDMTKFLWLVNDMNLALQACDSCRLDRV